LDDRGIDFPRFGEREYLNTITIKLLYDSSDLVPRPTKPRQIINPYLVYIRIANTMEHYLPEFRPLEGWFASGDLILEKDSFNSICPELHGLIAVTLAFR
jgi:hypothetical protein